ncbi:glycosyltransferase [Fructilactobacillus vespulae]|uniref:glycosyltransferase family 2 protein n=1 Tax=Fructilactobacillus vespulae TaxID=1249630 RepID=UPI0039B5AF36
MTILGFIVIILVSYPILGAMSWITGSIIYNHEKKNKFKKYPQEKFVSILIAARDEEKVIGATLEQLLNHLNYTNYEVLVINDGSQDNTLNIVEKYAENHDNLRIVNLEENQGKANALNIGLAFAKGDYVLTNDADSFPEENALKKYISILNEPYADKIGGITSNMDVQNRTKLITKSQTLEFSSIIGVIKRTQMAIIGGIYSYSGANTFYNKKALIDIGLFRTNRATEDISAAWDQQINGWLAIFEPKIHLIMQAPENIVDLYHQRKRWSKGGIEAWITNCGKIFRKPFKNWGLTELFIDQTISIIWSFFFLINFIIFAYYFFLFSFNHNWDNLYTMITISMIFVCFELISGIMQLIFAMVDDKEINRFRYMVFSPLYLLFYWLVNTLTIITSIIPAINTFRGHNTGKWTSPKRSRIKI